MQATVPTVFYLRPARVSLGFEMHARAAKLGYRQRVKTSVRGIRMAMLEGTIVSGLGFAGRNSLPVQLPVFQQQFDELCGAHPATINIDVRKPIDLRIDFRTLPFPCGN